jgi:FtsP/CotA-like multicopper oxidase with cupredoxin domain
MKSFKPDKTVSHVADSNFLSSMGRRSFLKSAGIVAAGHSLPAFGLSSFEATKKPDYTLTIANCSFEVARNKFLKTIAYNQEVPGPLLRLKQGRSVLIDVRNQTTHPEVVHWHGLGLPPSIDGAMEEGTPMIMPGDTARLRYTPDRAGLRWYHTHTKAESNLQLGQFSGQHGILLVDPITADPACYDREIPLILHDWDGEFNSADDGMMQVAYNYSTINGRVETFAERLRVKSGERVLLQILNASATDVHWLSFSGHQFQIVALDGNALSAPVVASMLRLAPAERITALVTMNNPGRWVLAEPRKHVRAAGMGMVVEYASSTGQARWDQPSELKWDYADFAETASGPAVGGQDTSPKIIPIVIESRFRGHGDQNSGS